MHPHLWCCVNRLCSGAGILHTGNLPDHTHGCYLKHLCTACYRMQGCCVQNLCLSCVPHPAPQPARGKQMPIQSELHGLHHSAVTTMDSKADTNTLFLNWLNLGFPATPTASCQHPAEINHLPRILGVTPAKSQASPLYVLQGKTNQFKTKVSKAFQVCTTRSTS